MDKNEMLAELDEAATGFLKTFASFTGEQINAFPFEGSWTPGQVSEHVLKSASGILHALNGPVKTTDRNPAEHVALLRKIFLDFSHKMKGPEIIAPSTEPKNQEALTGALIAAFAGIKEAAETKNLEDTYPAFPMPGLGELTGVEFVNFITVHTKRHTHQLQNIATALQPADA